MIRWNNQLRRQALDCFCRLDSMALRQMDPDAWNRTVLAEALSIFKRLGAAEDGDCDEHTSALVDMYRLAYRARVWRLPKEYLFWLPVARLHVEAHVGPDALLEQEEYLGPLWRRLEAIRARHGWPDKGNGGDEWDPEEHLDQLPDDYVAWSDEFDRVADQMEKATLRAVCDRHGVPEIADLKEQDTAEFERRCKVSYECAQRDRRGAGDGRLPGPGGYTSNQGDG
jgi:hypothetical protein